MRRLLFPTILLVAACGDAPAQRIFRIIDIEPGPVCEFGGAEIYSGPDDNGNGELEDAEIDRFELRCFSHVLI